MRRAAALLTVLLSSLLPACAEDASAHDFPSDVEECKANLREIFAGLRDHAAEHGGPPSGSGVAFFAELIAGGTWPADEVHARRLTCPGVPVEELPGLAGRPPAEWFASLEGLGPDSSAYAGRDQAGHPLRAFPGPGTEALVACDNHHGRNHAEVTNVLMSDGSVLSLELSVEKKAGRVPAEADRIEVGPGSPLPELQSLSQGGTE